MTIEMIKAKFLAKEYMEDVKISKKEEIDKIIARYDELNDIGIKFTNFQLVCQHIFVNSPKKLKGLN